MLEAKTETIDGVEFNFVGMDPFAVVKLEKKLAPLLLPIIGGLKVLDVDADLSDALDMEALSKGLREAISELPDADFEAMLREILRHVSTSVVGKGVVACNAEGASVFQGNTFLLYKVVLAYMRYAKFLPFAVLERGGAILGIVSSFARTQSQPASGLKLERSGRSQKNSRQSSLSGG